MTLSNKCGSDPIALFGPDGKAYYVLLNFDYTSSGNNRKAAIAVARSEDGEIWPNEMVRIVSNDNAVDKEWALTAPCAL